MSFLQETNDLLSNLFSHTPLTERQIKELKQVITEMGGNAIEWGHRKNAELPLKIVYRIGSDHVKLIITDQGPGFDRALVVAQHQQGVGFGQAAQDARTL